MQKWILITLLLASPSAHSAEIWEDGNSLYLKLLDLQKKTQDEEYPPGEALGYIVGIADTLAFQPSTDYPSCVPKTATKGQLGNVVFEFLRDHPLQRHFTAANIVMVAFNQAFPCQKK